VTAIDTRLGTVSWVEAVMFPAVAEIIEVPTLEAEITPEFPEALLILATPALLELQMTDCSVCVVPSLKVPTANIFLVVPVRMEGFDGAMEMEARPGGVKLAG
jgi:hypothetical protein